MHHLSDDELLNVFAAVDLVTLVGPVRAVCHRWRNLAMHHDVWKHRHLSTSDAMFRNRVDLDMMTRALEVAPCLRSLDFNGNGNCSLNSHFGGLRDLAGNTKCAVEKLGVLLSCPVAPDPEEVLRNQISRGRLRRVDVEAISSGSSPTLHQVFFGLLGGLRLDEFSFTFSGEGEDECALVHTDSGGLWSAGSLKRLEYYGSPSDKLLTFFLRSRVASLESVSLYPRSICGISAPTLRLLASCTNLTEVDIPVVVELDCLQRCSNLSSLTLDASLIGVGMNELRQLLRRLLPYFKSSAMARMKKIDFRHYRSHMKGSLLQMHILFSFATFGWCSDLEELSIGSLCGARASDVFGVVLSTGKDVEASFPWSISPLEFLVAAFAAGKARKLRKLQIHDEATAKFFSRICPEEFPKLEEVTVTGVHRSYCFGELFAEDVLLELLCAVRRMPRLHVQFVCDEYCHCYDSLEPNWFGVFGHSESDPCCLHGRRVHWQHVDTLNP